MAKKLNDLREILFSVMDDLRSGDCEPRRAVAICKVASALLETAELELRAIEKLGVGNVAAGFITIEPKQIEPPLPVPESPHVD